MKVKNKVSSFLSLHSDISKNDDDYANMHKTLSMLSTTDGTWICHALDRPWSPRPSKLNIRFVSSLTVFYFEGHNSSIQSAIDVHDHLMESLFDMLSNKSDLTSISCRQGLQIIKICCYKFCRVLRCRCGPVNRLWDPSPSGSTHEQCGEHFKDV